MPMIPVKEAPRGVRISEPTYKEHETDLLIVGGGMGATGAAVEAVRWAKPLGIKVFLCDKAALERSGAVAQGLSAINTFLENNTPDDYVRMVRNDLMHIVRDDLIFDVGRHVDDSVKLFQDWGLPIWAKADDGVHNLNGAEALAAGKTMRSGAKPVRSGRWQIMINGESYKCIVAEAAKKALGDDGYMERCFIVKLLLDKNTPNRIAGAVGFSTRENVVHIFKTNAMIVCCGGAVNIYRPRSTGEGMGRAWYPVWNAGSTYTLCAQVGAEMTMMENRFVPARFKDGYGPVGAWFLLFKAKATNCKGEDYCATNRAMLVQGAVLYNPDTPDLAAVVLAVEADGDNHRMTVRGKFSLCLFKRRTARGSRTITDGAAGLLEVCRTNLRGLGVAVPPAAGYALTLPPPPRRWSCCRAKTEACRARRCTTVIFPPGCRIYPARCTRRTRAITPTLCCAAARSPARTTALPGISASWAT